MHPTGSVTVFTGSHSHGQGHETTFAQIVADTLGVPIENVEIVHGDTAKVPFGMGTYGSRSLAVGGSAMVKALDKIVTKAKQHRRPSARGIGGRHRVQGRRLHGGRAPTRRVPFGEVALTAYVPHNYPIDELEPGLEEKAFYDPANFTYPGRLPHLRGRDRPGDRRHARSSNFIAVDDVGRVINPMIVEGQVHGGLAQGIGQALLESCVYDNETGQLLTGSYMDYTMPRADDLPLVQGADHDDACARTTRWASRAAARSARSARRRR